ncbi:ATP-dependent helicase HrpB [Paraneptunicella aestuarii]|uniref:ATP-dependent helicase HrpB n=1 Tax=Paraneptunicella aestuarii TaxID=2831148 RepID=UPI001E4CDFD9|nr:ATP-dependent helicase HrpB [Paraneptunicella aestuarii]UAA37811.1 ATP-dependent helicase HrpB [Paraneptunicella aestuarii]
MLPIEAHIPNILSALKQNSSLVLQAEPGAGKSTLVPLRLMESELAQGKKIVMLEPRRVAARSIASYLAKQLNEKVGERVGYQIRNERKVSEQTLLEIVTEGVLTRRLQSDPELSDVGLVIFDEFHERSIHADLALMLALEAQEAYREDLKILVMSATIDTEQVSNYLNQAPVICCPGRTFPVSVEYFGKAQAKLSEHIMRAVNKALSEQAQGDILVFLPGQADIQRCMEVTASLPFSNVEYLALYGALTLSEQSKVLGKADDGKRRVIFATNIAETSLTIEGITTVIDSGLEKVLAYDVKSGLSRLEMTTISKASATQRAGRAGRIQAGHCIRLWSETEQNSLKAFQAEEITVTDLTDVVLELAAWGITQYEDANWLTPPPQHHYEVARTLNQSLNLLDVNNKPTSLGLKALSLGLTPRLASMILSSNSDIEKVLSCLLAALLSERDILVNSHSSDITERVMILSDFLQERSLVKNHLGINKGVLEQVRTTAINLASRVNVSLNSFFNANVLSLSDIQQLSGLLLLRAYPDRLAKVRGSLNKNSKNNNKYLLANGRGVTLRDEDSMQGSPWIVVCDCDGKNKDGTIYTCAPIDSEPMQEAISAYIEEKTHYRLDAKKEQILARKITSYRALVLKEEALNSVPKTEFTRCVADILQEEGLTFLNWTEQCTTWVRRAQWLGEILNEFPIISEQQLLNSLDTWLLPYITQVETIKQLKQINVYELLLGNLSWEEQQFLAKHAPEQYVTPSDKKVDIRYDEHQGPTVSVILQEMFGQITSPRIAQGKVPLRFELLSPARRPIQTTSDLENFWQSSYLEVAKEMRGKYPKHRWPENALEAEPGRSIKPRG